MIWRESLSGPKRAPCLPTGQQSTTGPSNYSYLRASTGWSLEAALEGYSVAP